MVVFCVDPRTWHNSTDAHIRAPCQPMIPDIKECLEVSLPKYHPHKQGLPLVQNTYLSHLFVPYTPAEAP